MNGTYVTDALAWLISTLFGLYILVVMLRFLLQLVRANFRNPVAQFIVKVTNPPLKFLRRIVPGLGGIDFASVMLMLLLQILSNVIVAAIAGQDYTLPHLLIASFTDLVALAINVFIFSILIEVILSWVNPSGYNPSVALVHSLNEPILRPARRAIPPISGIDLSPLVVMLALQLLKMLLIPTLLQLGGLF